jgi:hypothetical protein
MRSSTPLDRAITEPYEDLLGIKPYATRLANYLLASEPNLTIGVYGRWGAGKTSFVQLVQRELGDRVRFIPFVAWPYKTSDELWRALVLSIAGNLYDIPPESILSKSLDPDESSLWERVKSFLRKDAIVLQRATSMPERIGSFKKLVEELDQIQLGSIRKSGLGNLQNDDALLATAKTVAAAVSAVSPLGATIRAFFGVDGGVKLSDLAQKDTNKATLTRIQSIERFRVLLRRLFDEQAPDARVCVFIDDLDRAMPDVALDLLEAIRIFLGNVNCTFIVAADQELIGQGLKARYHDLIESAQSEQDQETYARRGREYFEKIIQFSVPVPESAPADSYRYIAATYPAWACAADVVSCSLGSNPRRLRQYCNLLDYRYRVSSILPHRSGNSARTAAGAPSQGTQSDPVTDELSEKIVGLHWRDDAIAAELARLAGRADGQEKLKALESLLGEGEPYVRHPDAEARLADADTLSTYLAVIGARPVADLLASPPPLGAVEPLALQTLLCLRDVQPGRADVLKARDPAFGRIVDKLLQGIPVYPTTLLREDLARIVELNRDAAEFMPGLIALAQGEDYAEQMRAVDECLRDPTRDYPDHLSAAARGLLDLTRDVSADAKQVERRLDFLMRKPLPFTLQRQVIREFAAVAAHLPSAASLVSPANSGAAMTAVAEVNALADHLLSNLMCREELEKTLQVRITLARQCMERRAFAKVDALGHAWPELGIYLKVDLPALLSIENHVIKGQGLADLLARFVKDERLLRFMKLRPYFQEIYASELKSIGTAAVAAAPSASPTATSPVPFTPPVIPPAPAPSPIAAAPPIDEKPRLEAVSPPVPARPAPIQPAEKGRETGWKPPQEWKLLVGPQAGVTGGYVATLEMYGEVPWTMTDKSVLDLASVAEQREVLLRTDQSRRALQRLGRLVFEQALPRAFRAPILQRLDSGTRVRLTVKAEGQSSSLPWEAMYIDDQRAFPVLDGRLSVVRSLQEQVAPASLAAEFDKPLRILAVVPSPVDSLSINFREELDILAQVLAPAVKEGLVQYSVVSEAEQLRQAVRRYRPQVFHFFGHSGVDAGTGFLQLSDRDQEGSRFTAHAVQELLADSGVVLAVLLGSETAGDTAIGLQNSVAGRLLMRGTPAVIGTLCPVQVNSALVFSRTFYEALLRGNAVEDAVMETRRRLEDQGHDWSAYVLCANATHLESLALGTVRA